MSKITNDGLAQDAALSCTDMATLDVKGLKRFQCVGWFFFQYFDTVSWVF